MGAGWRLWLGLILDVLGILVAVFSIGTGIMLVGLALGVLTVIVGLIQVSFWSRVRACGCDRRRLSLQTAFQNAVTRSRESGCATLLLFQALSHKGLPQCTPFYAHFDPRSASSILPCLIAIEQRHVASPTDDLGPSLRTWKLVAEGTTSFITHEL